MLVRVTYGHKAGQIQDIEFTAAKQMIADGRASEIRYNAEAAEAEGVAKLAAVAGSATEPETKKTSKKKASS